MTEPIIIEFFGPPGVGKSTVAREVYNRLKDQKIDNVVFDNLELGKRKGIQKKVIKLKFVIKYFIQKPKNFFLITNLIFKTKQRTLNDFLKVLFNHIFVVSNKNTFKKNAIYILDQGFLQSIWSINLYSQNKVSIKELLEIDSSISLVVNVKADIDTINKRLKGRKGKNSRIEKNASENILNINEFGEIINNSHSVIDDFKIISFENNKSEIEIDNLLEAINNNIVERTSTNE